MSESSSQEIGESVNNLGLALMEFERLSRENGLWTRLWLNWDSACSEFNESFSDFAPSALSVLKTLAEDPQTKSAGVFGVVRGDDVLAACQLNVAGLPGYSGKVLRLRHLVLSPRFDFSEDTTVDDYVDVLSTMFAGTVRCAETAMPADHIKLHFRSPADREFFNRFQRELSGSATFGSVQMRGAWLYLTKTQS
ncbi:hypothetical protein [Rhodovulum sp.]|uniref:hypothetical protein n=1 Tax=Rhodovulum sp. TaxID=34009 RepID=UPI00178F57DB|nr:hypothetical protein [Rhodovulum sp.]HDR28646.1 hypothetical protein [Rhodovulum sp.]